MVFWSYTHTSKHELSAQQAMFKQEQSEARVEIVERTRPADHRSDKSLYPICDTFMANAVEHTVCLCPLIERFYIIV